MGLVVGLMGLILACYGGLWGDSNSTYEVNCLAKWNTSGL